MGRGWQPDQGRASEALQKGKPAETDRRCLKSLNHSFTLDIIAHGQSEVQAHWLQARIATRLAQCHLELHPTKTHMVYCKDADRRGTFSREHFDFLGYTFRPRRSKNRWGKYFINFTPAVSARATKAMRQTIRSWRLHLRSDKTLDDCVFHGILPRSPEESCHVIHGKVATQSRGKLPRRSERSDASPTRDTL